LGDLWDDVEVGLGSPGRIRTLRALLKKPGKCFTTVFGFRKIIMMLESHSSLLHEDHYS